MNKVSKRFLIVTVLAWVLLIVAVCIGLDLYAGSRGVRERLEARAQRELGLRVKIGAVHYNFWSGLRATDIVAEAGLIGAGPSSISLPSVSGKMAIWPLFSGHVVVKQLVFHGPSLILAQSADGGWALPLGKPASGLAKATPKSAEHAVKGPKLEFKVQAVRIEDARLQFVGKEGKNLSVLEGVTVDCPLDTPGKAAGTVAVRSAVFRSGLTIEAFSAPFTINGNSLTLSPLDARLAGGSVGGSGTVGTTSGHPPFTLDLVFNGVDLAQLLSALGSDQTDRRTAGVLRGNLDIYGFVGEKKSIGGAGFAQLRGGKMEQLPLVQLIGSVLQIDIADIELRQAQLDLRAGEGKVLVDSLVLESPSISLTAKGTSDFDGKLDLAARLAVSSKVTRQLPGWVEANFQPMPGSDRRDIGFAITGTLARPKTDLLQVMVGKKLGNQFMNLLQSVTGKPKKKSGDKKTPEPEPSPAEEE